jgi:hypothetical protein
MIARFSFFYVLFVVLLSQNVSAMKRLAELGPPKEPAVASQDTDQGTSSELTIQPAAQATQVPVELSQQIFCNTDIVIAILSHIVDPLSLPSFTEKPERFQEVVKLREVSRTFKGGIEHLLIEQRIHENFSPDLLFKIIPQFETSYFSVTLEDSSQIRGLAPSYIKDKISGLKIKKTLTIEYNFNFAALLFFPQLTSLSLTLEDSSQISRLEAIKDKNFDLTIENTLNTEDDFAELLTFPQLTSLSLTLGNSSQLSRLEAIKDKISDLTIESIVNTEEGFDFAKLLTFPELTCLTLSHYEGNRLRGIDQLQSLKKLELENFSNIENLDDIGALISLQHLKLKKLPKVITLDALQPLKDLKSFFVEGCQKGLSIRGIKDLPLERLYLGGFGWTDLEETLSGLSAVKAFSYNYTGSFESAEAEILEKLYWESLCRN